ncbi:MAG: hypothetical protein R6U43_07270 [Candidatus Krumholzibacteriales bacterium]
MAILLIIFIFPACDEDEDIPSAGQSYLSIVSGNNQNERTGALLPQPLVVRAADLAGNNQPGITVRFSTADSAATVNPSRAITDGGGLASCSFLLGGKAGLQHVSATTDNDSTTFTAVAEEPGCVEESLMPADHWDKGHIYICTTSSSLLGSGMTSVIIDFDPVSEDAVKVLDTAEELIDIAFSPRGELFAATDSGIFKVNPQTMLLESYKSLPSEMDIEMAENPGGVLLCVNSGQLFTVFCDSEELEMTSLPPSPISYENLALDKHSRDAYYMHSTSNYAEIHKMSWDGRDIGSASFETMEGFTLASSSVRGMATDSTGAVYITVDGNESQREIRKFDPQSNSVSNFFDFYDHFLGNNTNAGRWGDLTVCDGVIYIIDRRNDRMAYISLEGNYLGDMESPEFSLPGIENERYGIASIP